MRFGAVKGKGALMLTHRPFVNVDLGKLLERWSRLDIRFSIAHPSAMSTKEEIEQRLEARFQPISLEVIDESHQHHGHAGWRAGGETHFRVRIIAAAFQDMGRLQRHRAINEALQDQLQGGVHALAIEAAGPL